MKNDLIKLASVLLFYVQIQFKATTVDNKFYNKVYKPNGRMLKIQLSVWGLDDAFWWLL